MAMRVCRQAPCPLRWYASVLELAGHSMGSTPAGRVGLPHNAFVRDKGGKVEELGGERLSLAL